MIALRGEIRKVGRPAEPSSLRAELRAAGAIFERAVEQRRNGHVKADRKAFKIPAGQIGPEVEEFISESLGTFIALNRAIRKRTPKI